MMTSGLFRMFSYSLLFRWNDVAMVILANRIVLVLIDDRLSDVRRGSVSNSTPHSLLYCSL